MNDQAAGSGDDAVVELKVEGRLGWITLNRPAKRNAIDAQMSQELGEALRRLSSDPDVGVVILTGRGTTFCAGHDVHELMDKLADHDGYVRMPGTASLAGRALRAMPQITIAMVNGQAVGEGQDLALACDLVVAADSAEFSDPHYLRGVLPSSGAWLLPRSVGPKRAMEFLLFGTKLSAGRALELGLINRVAPTARLEDATRELAEQVLALPQLSIRLLKRLVQKGAEDSLEDTLELVEYARSVASKTDDAVQGGRTFFKTKLDA